MAYSYAVSDQTQISQRSLAFILVVGIHALFFWVLSSGLGAAIVQTVINPAQTTFIDDLPKTDAKPPPPLEIEQKLPAVPMPDVVADVDAPAGDSISVAPWDQPVVQPSPAAPTVKPTSVRTPPSTMGRGARTPLPEYPPAARRAGEAGTVTLSCYVSEAGKCGEVSVVTSSGFARLDEAAVAEVQRNWRFVPAKEGGKPVAAQHTFAVTFRLND